jgi:hemolysin activation/secretion protein
MSGNRYHQTVAGAFENFVYSGRSETTELKLSRLIHRDAASKTTVAGGLLRKAYNAIDDLEIGAQQRRTSAWEAGGADHRQYLGDTIADATLSWRRSLDTQGAEPSRLRPATGGQALRPVAAGCIGQCAVPARWCALALQLHAARAVEPRHPAAARPVLHRWPLYGARLDGELTCRRNAAGSCAMNSHSAWASGQELFAGVDTGEVAGPTARFLTGQRLTGAALGLRGSVAKLNYDMFVATPLAKPQGFQTAAVTGGFNLQWSF